MKVVFILSDALRHDYIKYMPFLKEMAGKSQYYKNVVPGIGFCEISEYVSGISSLDNKNIFQITFNGEFGKQKNKKISSMSNVLSKIPKVRRYNAQYIDKWLKKNKKVHGIDSKMLRVRYNIPLDMLSYFKPTESAHEYDAKDFFQGNNIFEILNKNGLSYDMDDFVKHNKIIGTDEDRLARLNAKITNKKLADFTLLYIGKGELAHVMGTKSAKFHSELTSYDSKLNEIYQNLNKYYSDDYRFVILGDHGMVDINNYIDIRPTLKRIINDIGLKVGEDWVYFIDSTCFRVWIKDEAKKEICHKIIKNDISNYLEDEKLIKKIGKEYGDLIYMVKPGNVFFPDFFNVYKNKGMHGYTNEVAEQKGMLLIMGKDNAKSVYQEIELHKVKSEVLDIFGIKG